MLIGGWPEEKVAEMIAVVERSMPKIATLIVGLVERHKKTRRDLEEAILATEKSAASFMKTLDALVTALSKSKGE